MTTPSEPRPTYQVPQGWYSQMCTALVQHDLPDGELPLRQHVARAIAYSSLQGRTAHDYTLACLLREAPRAELEIHIKIVGERLFKYAGTNGISEPWVAMELAAAIVDLNVYGKVEDPSGHDYVRSLALVTILVWLLCLMREYPEVLVARPTSVAWTLFPEGV